MFIYTFRPAENVLISGVVVTGEHLTLYVSKKMGSKELHSLIYNLNMSSFLDNEHPTHHLLHNPNYEFSKKLDKVAHAHLKFGSENRLQALKEICQYLIDRQQNFELRKKEFREYFDSTEENQTDKENLENYDCTALFLLEDEVPGLLKAFQLYLSSDGLLKKAEGLAIYVEKMIKNKWELCKKFLYGKPKTTDEQELEVYYDNIVSLYFCLLKIDAQQQPQDIAEANTLTQSILQSPWVNTLFKADENASFIHDLQMIQKTCNNKA